MSYEELCEAIRIFQREIMMPDIDEYEKTDDDQGDLFRRIDSFRDEYFISDFNGEKEKEAAYVRYIFEMASEEFL